jgi:cytochrome P450
MSDVLTATDPLRPETSSAKAAITRALQPLVPAGLAMLRSVWPIAGFGSFYAVTRYDDVREVFGTDTDFGVIYNDNILALTGGEEFFLGLGDSPDYRARLDVMRGVMGPADLSRLGDEAEALAESLVAAANGRTDVVLFVRAVTFGIMASYLGIPEPSQGRLDVWATRLFAFQFMGSEKDAAWNPELQQIAPALRAHINAEISRRRDSGKAADDVLGRCLARQAAGDLSYSDAHIRTNLLCMLVGGPPQPAMVVPQGIEQLLRRPISLAEAQTAARSDNDAVLHDILFEAMRFDPLAPGLPRKALADHTVAAGTRRARTIPRGATVLVCFASAMMDGRRVPEPSVFRAGRLPHEYIHFGYGLHECFGRYINHATLHRIVKPLLRRPNLRRAHGAEGHLRKRGIFAERLVVLHG